MHWDRIKFIYKEKITKINNKNTPNETIIFWNGNMIMKCNSHERITRVLLRVNEPTTLVNYARVKVGLVWPLKSKLKYKK